MELTSKEIIRISGTLDMIPKSVNSILEVGCGDGRVSKSIYHKFNLAGIDVDMVKIRSFPGKRMIGDISSLPIKDKEFDLVLSAEVLEHLNSETFSSAIGEISRVAKQYILLTVPFKESLPANWERCSRCGHIFHAWGHVRRFNGESLKRLFKNALLVKKRLLGPRETWIPSLLYIIAKKLGNVWGTHQDKPVFCPKCGSASLQSEGNIFGKIFIRLIWRMDRISPLRKPIWIGCLYQKS